MAQAAPVQIGPYQIFEEIGRGGMSIVYRARDIRDGHIVALKVLPPELHHQDQLLSRFVKEGQSTLRLVHPNIVRTLDAGVADNTYYMAMELVQGQNLSEFLKQRAGPLPFDEALRILRQVASGLDYAHSQGILHRDIKPSNILLNQDGRAQITDFGVARDLGNDHTQVTMPGHSIGTPSYMSPEQARGDLEADSRSDIYSLGVVAYAMLTGKLPFEASSHLSLLRKIVDDAPTPPEVVNPQLNPTFANALKSVLAKDPRARYPTATAFVTALDAGMVAGTPTPRAPISDATIADMLVTPAASMGSAATVSTPRVARPRRSRNPLLAAAARARSRPADPSAKSKPIPRHFIAQPTPAKTGKGRRTAAYIGGAVLLVLVLLVGAPFMLRGRFVRQPQPASTAVALATSIPTEPAPSPTPVPPTPTESLLGAAVISNSGQLSESVESPTATPTVEVASVATPTSEPTTEPTTEPTIERTVAPTIVSGTTPARIAPPLVAATSIPSPTTVPTTTPTKASAVATTTPKPTTTPQPVATATPSTVPPTNTSLPVPTASPTPVTVAAASESPEPGATRLNDVDNAVYAYIPAAKFSMGSTRQDDEKPLHAVDLNPFWIMQTEVTNAQYARCVADGACTPPLNERMDDPAYADHPVVNVDWSQANDYATWVGGRLPTEAEWEMAARGTDLRFFPWGNNAPDSTLSNFAATINDTTPIATYPLGVSPFGLYDMAGNVEEWVADWYADDYYAASPAQNPLGPEVGLFRVVRGGSFHSDANLVLSTTRGKAAPNRGYASVGFRVVLDE